MTDSTLPIFVSQVGQYKGEQANLKIFSGLDEKKTTEMYHGLHFCLEESGVTDFKIFPNFDFGWLCGPSGYVAVFDKTKMFMDDLFHHDYFRVISAFEVKMMKDEKINIPEKRAEIRNAIRKAIPIETDTPPTLDDNEYGGWGPALGTNGKTIGLLSFDDTDEEEIGKTRWFLVVMSGLHTQTVQMLQNRDIEITLRNRAVTGTFDAGEQLYSKSKHDFRVVTYDDEFEEGGIKDRMLKIAKENNRRLAAIYADAADITLINAPRSWDETEIRTPGDGNMQITASVVELMKEAIAWWPNNRIIYPSTVISSPRGDPEMSEEAKRDLPPIKIRGARIGEFCSLMKKKEAGFEQILKQHNIKFLEHPLSSEANIETDFNTFRVRDDGIYWYNNCTDTTFDPLNCSSYGVIMQDRLVHGLFIINSKHLENEKVNRISHNWKNGCLNGYPVIYPFDPNITRSTNNTALLNSSADRFFSLYHGGGGSEGNRAFPKQLQGGYKLREELDIEKVSQDLAGEYTKVMDTKIRLNPRLIYCSPGIIEEPKYNFYRGDIN